MELELCDSLTEKQFDSISTDESKTIQCQWLHCELLFDDSDQLMDHFNSTHIGKRKPRYYCQWQGCHCSAKKRMDMVRHLRKHARLNSQVSGSDDDDGQMKEILSKSSNARLVSKLLELLHHPSLSDTAIDLSMDSRSRFMSPFALTQQCSMLIPCQWGNCYQVFSKTSDLNDHFNQDHNIKQNLEKKCLWRGCKYTSKRNRYLITHFQKHIRNRSFYCPSTGCAKAFGDWTALKRHFSSHSMKGSIQCPLRHCEKQKLSEVSLLIHLAEHVVANEMSDEDLKLIYEAIRKGNLEEVLRDNFPIVDKTPAAEICVNVGEEHFDSLFIQNVHGNTIREEDAACEAVNVDADYLSELKRLLPDPYSETLANADISCDDINVEMSNVKRTLPFEKDEIQNFKRIKIFDQNYNEEGRNLDLEVICHDIEEVDNWLNFDEFENSR